MNKGYFEILKFPSEISIFIEWLKNQAIDYFKKAHKSYLRGDIDHETVFLTQAYVYNDILQKLGQPIVSYKLAIFS